jgi:hypothetical protein
VNRGAGERVTRAGDVGRQIDGVRGMAVEAEADGRHDALRLELGERGVEVGAARHRCVRT